MELQAQSRGQLLAGEASLPSAIVPKSVDQRQQFVPRIQNVLSSLQIWAGG
jgi:hypothetical protein